MQTLLVCLIFAAAAPPAEIVPQADNLEITGDARIKTGVYRIPDADDNGVIHIQGDNIAVDFSGAEFIGSTDRPTPQTYRGTAITVTGKGVRIRNLRLRGYQVGIHARSAPGLTVEDVSLTDMYRQRLRSTPRREAAQDWLFPHENDRGQWGAMHGAGVWIERSDDITIKRVRVRKAQNGIVLDRVNASRLYDNDCSFLSGWGLALWRCSNNVISRNAFDFCIRGYSHGVYNRGQDSAGILMFEQNNENVIAENSATHCGDGLFGFGGTESLEGGGRTGNNANLIINNDFSYAAAHGLEMTFSFDNRIIGNQFIGNAICGVWGGYSQHTLIAGNTFEDNGQAGYGSERGGVNIEHGYRNEINFNAFCHNRCGVSLWADDDPGILKQPWARANHQGSARNTIGHNVFDGDEVAIELRETLDTRLIANAFKDVKQEVDADPVSKPDVRNRMAVAWKPTTDYPVLGRSRPVGDRAHLRGREKIVMTPWGPYDFEGYAVVPEQVSDGAETVLRILGPEGRFRITDVDGDVEVLPKQGSLPGMVRVAARQDGVQRFGVKVAMGDETFTAAGTLTRGDWTVRFFGWNPGSDPRTAPEGWATLLGKAPLEERRESEIDFDWGLGAPSRKVPPEGFGTLATTTLRFPAGRWLVRTISDDGIRVWVDGRLVIDNWTWHPPTEDVALVPLTAGPHAIRIEHFEIDGYARLAFFVEAAQGGD